MACKPMAFRGRGFYVGVSDVYNLKSLVKVPTCYKNPNNPICIDLILANKPHCFQNTTV